MFRWERMTNRVCRNTRREIDESELHQTLSDNAAVHLQVCAGCRAFHEERTRLRDLIGSLEPVTAPGDFDFRLRARIAVRTQSRREGIFSGLRFAMSAKIAAAVMVMLVASIVWVSQRTTTQPLPVARVEKPNNPPSVTTTGGNESALKGSVKDTNPGSESIAQKRNGTAVKPSKISSKTQGGRSYDLSEGSAESVVRPVDDAGSVSLAAPVKPLVVSMEDDRGATRTISLPPVSFGSQRLVDNRIPASSMNRVW